MSVAPKKRRFLTIRNVFLSLGLLLVMVTVLFALTENVSDSVQRESERVARDAIVRALIACYAAEGSYPASLSYLERRYGVVIDYEKYVVDYEIFSSNVMPEVTMKKRSAGFGDLFGIKQPWK